MTETTLKSILTRIPSLTIGVVGDLFLDRYLDIDAALTEPSLETGLDAYQVVKVRPCPGAAGTVVNNLVALGVKEIIPVSALGDDGEGYELRRALNMLRRVNSEFVYLLPNWHTPTYTKPLLRQAGESRELNRLDIKNRESMPERAIDEMADAIFEIWPRVDALVVVDQVSELGSGVVSGRVQETLQEFGQGDAAKAILADSRERIHELRHLWLKPNRGECVRGLGGNERDSEAVRAGASRLAARSQRPVFCTCGQEGILVTDARSQVQELVPAAPVQGAIDPVGAGDSVSAALACAVAAGASLVDAAAFANLVASVTIQQIGVTGTASPKQVRQRWQEMNANE